LLSEKAELTSRHTYFAEQPISLSKTKTCMLEFLGELLPFPAFLCTPVQIAQVVDEEEDNL